MIQRKLLSLGVLALLLLGGLQAHAQKVTVKINPLSLAVVTANLQGEYAINEKMSAQLGLFFGSVNLGFGASGADGGVGYNWYGVTPEFRYYTQGETKGPMRGFYVGPYLRYRGVSTSYTGSYFDPDIQANATGELTASINAFGGGVLLGYQWIFGDVFVLDLFIGPQYSRASTNISVECSNCDGNETAVDEEVGISFGGIGVRTGLALGVAF